MLRFLQILAAVVFARLLWGAIRMMFARSRPAPAGPGRVGSAGELIRCDRCALHVPADRILRSGGGAFCSQACRAGEN